MKTMKTDFKYFAFISYNHNREDEKWAKWLQNKLETYKLPSSLPSEEGKKYPKTLRPCFRDKADLGETGYLTKILQDKLALSQYLIVICSPRSAKSEWVNEEIETFQAMGKADKVIPFIIEGTPDASNPDKCCYPPALSGDILGISIPELENEKASKEKAAVKTIAAMLHIDFDTLWNRHRRRKRKQNVLTTLFSLLFIIFTIFLISNTGKKVVFSYEEDAYITIYEQYIKTGNATDELYKLYCKLNTTYNQKKIKIDNINTINTIKFSPIDSYKLLILGNDRKDAFIWNINLEKIENKIEKQDTTSFDKIFYSNDGKYIFGLLNDNKMCIWDDKGILMKSFNGYIDEYFRIWRDSIFFESEYMKLLRKQAELLPGSDKRIHNEAFIRAFRKEYLQEETEKYEKYNENNSYLIDIFYESYFKEIYLNQNVSAGTTVKLIQEHHGSTQDPIWSMDGQYIIVNDNKNLKKLLFSQSSSNSDLYKFDYRNFSTDIPSNHNYYTPCKIISPDNEWGVTVDNGGINRFYMRTRENVKSYLVSDSSYDNVMNMSITLDSKYAIFYTSNKRIYIIERWSGKKYIPIQYPKVIDNIILSPKSDFCYVVFEDENIWIYDMNLKFVNEKSDIYVYAKYVSVDNTGNNIIFYNDSLIVSKWFGLESLYNHILEIKSQPKKEYPIAVITTVDEAKWYHEVLFSFLIGGLLLLLRYVFKMLWRKFIGLLFKKK